MRQTGVMAGCAAYALTYNFPKLVSVHKLAAKLEQGLRDIGVNILSGAETCMVIYSNYSTGPACSQESLGILRPYNCGHDL